MQMTSMQMCVEDRDRLKHENRALKNSCRLALAACTVVQKFLHGLEFNTAPDDLLAEIRRETHKPLHAALDAAFAAEPTIEL